MPETHVLFTLGNQHEHICLDRDFAPPKHKRSRTHKFSSGYLRFAFGGHSTDLENVLRTKSRN